MAIAITAPSARAQSADAEALFDQGDSLMTEGKLVEACLAFEGSNRIEPRAGTLIRLGECREANHQLASAWSAYKDALSRVKDPRKRDIATARVADLESRLSYLTVLVPDDNRVGGLVVTRNGDAIDPALWNRPVPIDGGSYAIAARGDGYDVWHATVTVPVDRGHLEVEVPKLDKLVVRQPPPTPLQPSAVPVPVSPWTLARKLAIGVAGAGVVTAVVAGILGTQARSLQHDAFARCPDPTVSCADAVTAQHSIDRAGRRAIEADVGFGIAGAAVSTAVVLWLAGAPSHESSFAITPRIAPGVATVELAVRF